MPKSTHSSTIHHPFPNSTHCQAAGRSQEILRCMQRWKLRHLPGPERWVGKKFGNEGWHATRGAEIILPMNKLYIYIISNYFLGTEFNDSNNGTSPKILTIDSGVTEALADEGHGCAAELCSNAATQGAWLSGAETNQFTSSTGLYLCLCLLWMLWLLLSWMLNLGVWRKYG